MLRVKEVPLELIPAVIGWKVGYIWTYVLDAAGYGS